MCNQMQLARWTLLFAGTLLSALSHAQKYNVTELVLLPSGTFSVGQGMNNAGQIVGTADDVNGNGQAVLWANGTVNEPLPPFLPDQSSSGTAITQEGVVLGSNSGFDGSSIFISGPNASGEFESDLNPVAGAIDDANDVFGAERGHPVIWIGGVLGFTTSGLPNSAGWVGTPAFPHGVNTSGVVVGEEDHLDANDNFFPVAIRWTPAATSDPWSRWVQSTIKLLPALGGVTSTATAINNNGWIVGWASFKNGLTHAVLWEKNAGALDLGTLGGKTSGANGINVWGDIAGQSQIAGGAQHAVLWTHKHFTITDLNLEIGSVWSGKITLTQATATNDRCMVLTNGLEKKTSAQRTFLLTLVNQANCNGS
jgi:probable HAF family extracellular repeat protein